MGKSTKSVKKFARKHLGAAIAHRRKLKPMKNAIRKKSDAMLHAGYKKDKAAAAGAAEAQNGNVKKPKRVEDMDVDELMRGDFLDDKSDEEGEEAVSDGDDELLDGENEQDDFVDIMAASMENPESDEDEDETDLGPQNKTLKTEVAKHKQELERLQQKDPEFYQFLKEHDKELLDFDDEDAEDHEEEDEENAADEAGQRREKQEDIASVSLSTVLVEAWCTALKEKQHIGALKNLLRAFRTACHYGDGDMNELDSNYNITSSHVFNKIMLFVLLEIDAVLKSLLGLSGTLEKKSGGAPAIQKLPKWKKVEPFVKTYLGNALHILNQMTDNQMIAFTLRRLKASVIFMAAFPRLARKYLKVALHFWGSGEGALPLLSFMFIREMAVCLGTEYLESCLKGMYKEYAASSRFVNPTSQPRIQFMVSCVVELYGIDLSASYQSAFIFIRQLAIILRNALTMKTKESYKQVYRWQYINSLNLWVRVVSAYSEQLRPLAYPLAQVIDGVARLVPTAHYFPLRLQCVQMLNRLAAAMNTFVPVGSLLMDMLQFKDIHMKPTGGIGNALDFATTIKVSKLVVKTRSFQEACVTGVIEQLTEHLAQHSYSVSFPELAVVPLVQLRHLIKDTTVERFRRQVKLLVEQIERNVEYVGRKRDGVTFSPKDISAVSSFLEVEKKAGASPLSQFLLTLQRQAVQHQTALHTPSVVVGSDKKQRQASDNEESEDEEDDAEQGAKVFSNQWLPTKKVPVETATKKTKPSTHVAAEGDDDEDIVEDLMLSSDEDVDEEEDNGGGLKSLGDSDDDSGKKHLALHKKGRPMSVGGRLNQTGGSRNAAGNKTGGKKFSKSNLRKKGKPV